MANKNLSATITIGGLIGSSLKAAFGETDRYIDRVNEKVRNLNKRQKELNRIIQENEKDERRRSGVTDRLAREELANLDKRIAKLKQIQNLEKKRLVYAGKAAEARSKTIGATVGFTAATLPVIGIIRQAIEFESAMSGVSKQMDGARDVNGKLTPEFYAMRKEIQKAAREIPLTTVGVTQMAEASLRMGVAKKEVIGFTRSTAMMATAFEMAESEIADKMGKISNLYRIPITAINDLGDTINWLDNNTVSKSDQIIDFLLRAGGAASGAKITDKQMAALGSTMISLGTNTESAATSVRAMFTNLGAAAKMPKTFQNGLKTLGLSARSVQTGMQTDAMGTIRKLFEAIRNLPSVERKSVLYQLFGKEHIGNIEKLVNGTDQLDKQLALATGQDRVGSMMAEYENRLSTTRAQLQLTKNRLMEVSVNVGNALLPALNDFMNIVNPIAESMAKFAEENPKLTKSIIGVVGGVMALRVGLFGLGWVWNSTIGQGIKVFTTFSKISSVLPLLSKSLFSIGRLFLTNPIGIAVLAIGTAVFLIYKHWKPLKQFFVDLWERVKKAFAGPYEWIVGKIKNIVEMIGNAGKRFFELTQLEGGEGIGIGMQPAYAGVGSALPEKRWNTHSSDVRKTSSKNSRPIYAALPDAEPLPKIPSWTKGPVNNADNRQYSFNIFQQPGQDPRELARQITLEQVRMDGISQRSRYYDGAGL